MNNYQESKKRLESASGTEKLEFIRRSKICQVKDLRNLAIPSKEIYMGDFLLIIDGETCSGKSTIARKIEDSFPCTTRVLDVDEFAISWLRKQLQACKSSEEEKTLLKGLKEEMKNYVEENLEQRVLELKGEKRTVILVDCFVKILDRAIVAKAIGQYFDNVVCFTVHEDAFTLSKNIAKRHQSQLGHLLEEQVKAAQNQHNYFQNIISEEIKLLGVGFDDSFIINNKTRLM